MPHHNRKMRFDRMFRAMGPFVAMAAMGGLMAARKNGWNGEWAKDLSGKANFGKWDWNFQPGPGRGGKFRFNGQEGVTLDDLEMSGDAPVELVVACGDHVTITAGEDFGIALQGSASAKARMRFVLEDGVLFVMRDCSPATDDAPDGDDEAGDAGFATVSITMPAPEKLTIAGSGKITTATLAAQAAVVIAGSGRIEATALVSERLEVTIAGSGCFSAGGTAQRLEVSVAGSGTADMAALSTERAEIDIAGSGNVTFASDGKVKANIMGSGVVTVRGSARCKVHSMGSGSLVCERGEEKAA